MIISVHIPKTGGVTFRNYLLKVFGDHVYFDYGAWSENEKPEIPSGIKIIHGHFTATKYLKQFPNADLITWVRNPIEIPVSMYYYFKREPDPANPLSRKLHSHNLSLSKFIDLKNDWNTILSFMDGIPLDRFSFIGLLEDFDRSIALFNRTFQIDQNFHAATRSNYNPNVLGNGYNLDQDLINKIDELTKSDQLLYKEVRERFQNDVIKFEIKGSAMFPPPDYDELDYLTANRDVDIAIKKGHLRSGYFHLLLKGFNENRMGVNGPLTEEIRKFWDACDFIVPPEHLRRRVHGSDDILTFELVGKRIALDIDFLLREREIEFSSNQRVLDFGCGCGRVLQWLRHLNTRPQYFGSDVDAGAITWCREILSPEFSFNINKAYPPLDFPDNYFDLIYVVSVFTHLPEDVQFVWLKELTRVLKPHGYALISTAAHGERIMNEGSEDLLLMFETKGFICVEIRGPKELPDYYNQSYHKSSYIFDEWSRYFDIVGLVEKGINNHQDAVICMKRT